jgi:hypothetical protein
MNAPKAVILLLPVAQGDKGAWRRSKPCYQPPLRSKRPPNQPCQVIPPDQREAIKRMADAMREAHARQICALHAA